ncbi:predicted protein [Nematostella vectensis]|uniref:G-protein coupled receptors family 1 profile domain-containing protein n=1 Tax=Nematostella vectensis TaxID=45351 RepID=A7RWC2_NEMVE|nr:predicted protein [Nematostella vectensis]|eukprot:XP_001636353.1 predicted protein [Nematostella vectensis]
MDETGRNSSQSHLDTIVIAVLSIEGITIASSNLLTLLLFITDRSLRKRNTYFIASLALADTLVGVAAVNIAVFVALGHDARAVLLLKVPQSLAFSLFEIFVSTSSGLGLLIISIERFLATIAPMHHRKSGLHPYYLGIAAQWVLPTLSAIIALISVDMYNIYCMYLIVFFIFVFCFCYASIFIKFKLQNRQHQRNSLSLTQQRERELAKVLLTVTFVSVLCYVPTGIFMSDFHNTQVHVALACYSTRFANSLVNPAVYVLRMKEFKVALVNSLCSFHTRVYSLESCASGNAHTTTVGTSQRQERSTGVASVVQNSIV